MLELICPSIIYMTESVSFRFIWLDKLLSVYPFIVVVEVVPSWWQKSNGQAEITRLSPLYFRCPSLWYLKNRSYNSSSLIEDREKRERERDAHRSNSYWLPIDSVIDSKLTFRFHSFSTEKHFPSVPHFHWLSSYTFHGKGFSSWRRININCDWEWQEAIYFSLSIWQTQSQLFSQFAFANLYM